jgi:lactoylglutathione lyase
MNIDHIAIWTLDLEKEKDFFLKYFGCTVNEKYVNRGKKFESYFISFPDGSRIELMTREDIKEKLKGENSGLAHIAVNAGSREKVRQLTERLDNDGFIISSVPRVTGDGYYESVVLDPENNVIEIISLI